MCIIDELISYGCIIVYGAIHLSPASGWVYNYQSAGGPDMQAAFQSVFGQGLLIIIGSLIAFLIGQLIDVSVFHRIKKWTGEGSVWMRATGSTVVSQLIDSFVVIFIAFYLGPRLVAGNGEPWTITQFLTVSTNNYVYKVLMAILLTPLIYLAHHLIDRYLGKEQAEAMKEQAASMDG